MSMYIVETSGLRILMWGDNRHNPSEYAMKQLGDIDVLTLPVDGSQHILSYEQGDDIVKQLRPKVVYSNPLSVRRAFADTHDTANIR